VNDARLWHPWLRINRVLRVMERGGVVRGPRRVQEGARAEESDSARRCRERSRLDDVSVRRGDQPPGGSWL